MLQRRVDSGCALIGRDYKLHVEESEYYDCWRYNGR